MATTFYKDTSSESSPIDGDVEKGELGRHARQEEVGAQGTEDDAETSIARRKEARARAPGLHQTRSHSLQRSYAGADGYTHFEHEEEEEEGEEQRRSFLLCKLHNIVHRGYLV